MIDMSDLNEDEEEGAQRPLVQIITIKINGVNYGLVGPVVLVPGLMSKALEIDVSEIEFGEIMPVTLAARMLEGDFKRMMGAEVH